MKRFLLIVAVFNCVASGLCDDQAGQVSEIQRRLDKARAEEDAAHAQLANGRIKFSDFAAASNKRAALEAELAKAKSTPAPAPAARTAEIQSRLDKAKAEEAAAHAAFASGQIKFSEFAAASNKRRAVEAELTQAESIPASSPGSQVSEIERRLDKAKAEEDAAHAAFANGEITFSEFAAASNKRATLEAERAKAKAKPITTPFGPTPTPQARGDKATTENTASTITREQEVEHSKTRASSGSDDEVQVPDLSALDQVADMKAAATEAGLVPALAATKATPPPGPSRLFAGQEPAAGSKTKRGSTLKIVLYQQVAQSTSPSPTASPTPVIAAAGTMPNLIGLTIEQAAAMLPANSRIGSDEIGDKPPSSDKALTIFHQYPPAGQNISKGVVVAIKRYGSGESTDDSSSVTTSTDSTSGTETKPSGPTDIENTVNGEFWKSRRKKPTAATKASPATSPTKKTHKSDWWRRMGHDRPDYDVPDN